MKFLKRTVSLVLAFLMLFTSMSVLASAEIGDGNRNTVVFDTKFYRKSGTEWVETTKAARGEKLKARITMNTDFVCGASTIFWLFNKNNLVLDPSGYTAGGSTGSYNVTSNISCKGDFVCVTEKNSYAEVLINNGSLPANVFETYGYIYLTIFIGEATKIPADDWAFEFDFTVTEDASETAQMFFPVSCLVNTQESTWENPSVFAMCADSNQGGNVADYEYESFDLDMVIINHDQDEDSTLTFQNTVKFNAVDGKFANGQTEFTTSNGFIGDDLSAADKPQNPTPATGKTFVGWLPSSADPATATADDCVSLDTIKYNYTADTYTALYTGSAATTTYDFAFDANGGVFGSGDSTASVTVNEGEAVTVTEPTKVGHTFKGWALSTVENPTVSDVVALPAAASASASYKAVWEKNQYKVTWEINGVTKQTKDVYYGDAIPAAPTGESVNKEGHTLSWSAAPATMPANNVTITGTYTPKTYTVTWKVEGTVVGTSTETYGQPLTPPEFTAPDGKTFGSWTNRPDTMPDNENLVINGTYTTNQVTITYYLDEAKTNVYYTKTVDYNSLTPAHPDGNPSVKGKSFVGWDATIPERLTSDLKVSAMFNDIEYTIEFKMPDDTLIVEPAQTLHYEDEIVAPEFDDCDLYEGHTFDGTWTYNGEAIELPKTVKEILGNDDASATLTFVGDYTPNNYYVSFFVNDIEEEPVFEEEVPYGTKVASIEGIPTKAQMEAKKPGYTFTGWDPQITENLEVLSDTPIVAKWTINQYTISFNSDGGTAVNSITQDYNTAVTAPADPSKTGYTFDGWYLNNVKYTFTTMPAENIELKAKWNANQVEITFDSDGGTAVEPIREAFGTTITAPTAPTKTGYTFDYWTLNGEKYTFTTMPAETIELKAKWTINQYTISFDSDGGTAVSPITQDYNTAVTAPANPGKTGYTFGGWTLNGEAYTFDKMPAENIELKAKWTIKTYTVTWTVDGETYTTTQVVYDEAIIEPSYTAPTGKSFAWDAHDAKMPANDNLVINGTTSWIDYTIKFVDADGNPLSSGTYHYDETVTAPSIDAPTGMVLAGWVDNNGNAFNGKAPAGNVTYKPNFVNKSDVSYKIEVYLQNTSGEYELSASTTLTGTTGQSVSVQAGAVTGFTLNADDSVLSGTIAGNGTTKLVLKYARNTYKAKFGTDSRDVFYGAALPEVTPAEQTGKKFVGWVDSQGNAAPATMPANDLVLSAKYEDIEYTITYIVNGKTTVQTYKYNDTVTALADPVVEGMTFIKWVGEGSIPATMPAKDLIFEAEFEQTGVTDVYTVRFWVDDVVYDSRLVKVGATIALPTGTPTKDNYVFKGWKNVPAEMPERDLEIYADFDRIPVVLVPKDSTVTTVIDRDNMFIYGLEELITEADYANYLAVEGDGYFEVVANPHGYGTGTEIKLYDNVTKECLETYYVIIFGDINGDALVDSTDVSMATNEAASVTKWSVKQKYSAGNLVDNSSYVAYMAMAADLDKDGMITSNDIYLINSRSLSITTIDQATGTVVGI